MALLPLLWPLSGRISLDLLQSELLPDLHGLVHVASHVFVIFFFVTSLRLLSFVPRSVSLVLLLLDLPLPFLPSQVLFLHDSLRHGLVGEVGGGIVLRAGHHDGRAGGSEVLLLVRDLLERAAVAVVAAVAGVSADSRVGAALAAC